MRGTGLRGRHGLEGMEGADRNPQRFQCGRGGESGEMDCRGSRPRFQGLGNLGDGVVATAITRRSAGGSGSSQVSGVVARRVAASLVFLASRPRTPTMRCSGALRRQRESKPGPTGADEREIHVCSSPVWGTRHVREWVGRRGRPPQFAIRNSQEGEIVALFGDD